MDKILKQALLYDFYGELLTEHQKSIYEDFVLNDYSLSEIGEDRKSAVRESMILLSAVIGFWMVMKKNFIWFEVFNPGKRSGRTDSQLWQRDSKKTLAHKRQTTEDLRQIEDI